jgi:antitoxin CptB
MTEPLEIRRKRLRFRCWHRGTKEADLLLGHFADRYLDKLSVAELDDLEALLEEPDVDVVAWITGDKPPPAAFDTALMKRLQTLDYIDLPGR